MALDVIQDKQVEWHAAHTPEPISKKFLTPQALTNFIIVYNKYK